MAHVMAVSSSEQWSSRHAIRRRIDPGVGGSVSDAQIPVLAVWPATGGKEEGDRAQLREQ
jgi:hypothetical protein